MVYDGSATLAAIVTLPPELNIVVGVIVALVISGPALTVTDAVPDTVPLFAVTVNGPPIDVDVKTPLLIVPPPLTDQINTGCEVIRTLD
jgi:hypothetical protein